MDAGGITTSSYHFLFLTFLLLFVRNRIIILVNLNVLHRGIVVGQKLGDPKPFDVQSVSGHPQPPPPQRQPNQPLQVHSTGPVQNHGGGWGGNQSGGTGPSKPFYGNSPAPAPRSSPMEGGGAFGTGSPSGRKTCPIAALNPYQNRCVRACVCVCVCVCEYLSHVGVSCVKMDHQSSCDLQAQFASLHQLAWRGTSDVCRTGGRVCECVITSFLMYMYYCFHHFSFYPLSPLFSLYYKGRNKSFMF